MFDHVTLRVSDLAASERFYGTVLEPIGIRLTYRGDMGLEWDDFSLTHGEPTTGLHVGFSAPSREHVDAFWEAGRAAGHEDRGAPGPRDYTPSYYGAFLSDPDGNSIEAVHHDAVRRDGNVDHLWIRVSDLAAMRAFYSAVAPIAGFRVGTDTPERVSFNGESGSFSLVPGEPTRNLHLAFGAPDHATVDRFHAELVAAGHRDNGAPGERPQYHPGYYGAFVLDPEGHNIELVDHSR